MPASYWKVEELIPHRPPMVLIDRIESFDAATQTIVASFVGREEWKGNWSAIEYMAQTAAALAGALDRERGNGAGANRPGLLMGTRRMELGLASFVPGQRYLVKAVREFEDGDMAAFACDIWQQDGDGSARCTATITACRSLETDSKKEKIG